MEAIPWGAWLSEIGPATIVTVIVLMILAGRLRSDKQVQDLLDVHRQRVDDHAAETKVWREAYERSEAARDKQQDSIDDLLELARATEAILRSLEEGDPNGRT